MARALTAILSELNNVYNPQRDTVNQQLTSLDPAQQAEEKGLDAAKQDAFSQITDQANRRGLFYSGIPVQEEQKYTGSTFLPAVANLKSKYAQQRFNLQDTLNKINTDQYNQAYSLQGQEMDNEARMAAARSAARSAGDSYSPSFGGGNVLGASGSTANGFGMMQKSNKDFAFVDQYGRPVSAATYAQGAGIPFRTLLQQMAQAGDNGAKLALGFVGNDYGYDRAKVNVGKNAAIYQGLTWGGLGKATPFQGVGVPGSAGSNASIDPRVLLNNPSGRGLPRVLLNNPSGRGL